MKPAIGFNRHLEMTWLTQTAAWAASGLTGAELKRHIDSLLAPAFTSKVAMDKTRNLLFGIWDPQSKSVPLRFQQQACQLLLNHSEHSLVLHWGLLMAKYPFFYFVAAQLGRIARHDGVFLYSQLEQRVTEEFGDTSTIKRSMQFVVRTLVNLEILSNPKTGMYQLRKPITLTAPDLIAWLAEAVIRANDEKSRSLDRMNNEPALFPFDVAFTEEVLSSTAILDLHTQSHDIVIFIS
ncbi:MAG: hypothetical protein JJU10_11955 [Idiomarina sp.]|nr:hypothetical protein [Idiomarina sp.]